MMRRRGPLSRRVRARPNRRVDPTSRKRRRRRIRRTVQIAVIAAIAGLAGYHATRLARTRGWLDLFLVREVSVVGVQVTHPNVIVAEAGLINEALHVWSPLGVYADRVERDPMVESARFRRGFPNRLTLEIVERKPVAFLDIDRLAPVDSTGRVLPVSAFRKGWDAPVVHVAWPAEAVVHEGRVRMPAVVQLIDWLVEVERTYPALAREISTVDLADSGAVTLQLVHAKGEVVLDVDTPLGKLALIDDVLRDLREKNLPYIQLDLRFADQIVVRRNPRS